MISLPITEWPLHFIFHLMEESHKSIKGRDLVLEQGIKEEMFSAYVNKYIERIHTLKKDNDFIEENSYHEVQSSKLIMYKLLCGAGATRIVSEDGNRGYEFLVEFDKGTPAYGIYYGCRGLVLGGNQVEQIEQFKRDWAVVKGEITKVLNDTFIDKDYSFRYQDSTNADNKTFWPFWIALYEDEDVIDVAGRATKIIKTIYELYLGGRKFKPVEVRKKPPVRTCFTEAAFKNVISDIKEDCPSGKSANAISVFRAFLKNAEKKHILSRDVRYEKCWKFISLKNVEAAHLIAAVIKRMGTGDRDSWKYFTPILISKKDEPFQNLRQSYYNSKANKFVDFDSLQKDAEQLLEIIMDYK